MICDVNMTHPSEPLFKELRILNVKSIFIFNVQEFVFKFKNKLLPDILSDLLTHNNMIHGYTTRQSKQLHVPICTTQLCSKFIRYTGVYINNLLCSSIEENYSFET